jgi:hypothetical protein
MRIEITSGNPTPADIAAIAAAFSVIDDEQAAQTQVAPSEKPRSLWVDASRRSAQRAVLQRGPWRLSGRLRGRSRT